MQKMNLLSLLFPKKCIICAKRVNNIICNHCFLTIAKQNTFHLQKYSHQFFQKHVYMFSYEGEIRKIILNYKFNNQSYLLDYFVEIMIKNEKICRFLKTYDIIIPVPIHKKRKNERGYNQSELISKVIAKELNIKHFTDVLVKTMNTTPQSALTKNERFTNTKNVYKIQNIQKIKEKRVVLFDDIFTTGATANSCAKLLKENGAKEIAIFTIAKDILKN